MLKVKVKINKTKEEAIDTTKNSCCSSKSKVASEEPIKISTTLNFSDYLGSWKARWGINRMDYRIAPGLYFVGTPDTDSPVLVTANYKMTFDVLRKELSHTSAWILVLDTKGINVWCAAGKGTFGTNEIIHRINKVNLSTIVSHKNIILPQLGAPGVSAHEVTRRTGFKVIYGPVRAKDVKPFLLSGLKTTPSMRKVNFTLWDRLVLTPMEWVQAMKPLMIIFAVLFILNTLGLGHFEAPEFWGLLGAIFTGAVVTPVLLPWIPGKAFSFKGFLLGLLWVLIFQWLYGFPYELPFSMLKAVGFSLIFPSLSAYLALNFTGCSTYTSPSGVNKEMKAAIPLMLISTGFGVILFIIDMILFLL